VIKPIQQPSTNKEQSKFTDELADHDNHDNVVGHDIAKRYGGLLSVQLPSTKKKHS